MKPHTDLTRRQMLKSLGAGAAVLALGSLSRADGPAPEPVASPEAVAAPAASKTPPPQPFTLPSIDFPYDALEPYIDARTMELHHTKHHQAYIDAANRALAEQPQWQKKTAEELLKEFNTLPEPLRITVRNQVGGHVNHTQFWDILAPHPKRNPGKNLMTGIEKYFGSFEAFQTLLTDAAMKRFGSGWAWLSVDANGKLSVHSTANQDSPILMGLTPILGIDVWEHAYYLHYENRRLDYLQAIWNVLDWSEADQRFEKATNSSVS